MSRLKLPPGPKPHFLTGHLPEMRRDVLAFHLRCAREFGDVSLIRFGLMRVYLLAHPDPIEQVLVTQARNFIKHFGLRMHQTLLGNGLLTSEGDFWLRQRRLAQPAFSRDRVAAYAGVMVEYAERMAASWLDGEVRDLHRDMARLTLEIISKTLFNAEVGDKAREVGDALLDAMRNFNQRFYRIVRIPERIPTPGNLRVRRAIRRVDDILYGLIRERRTDGICGDLLSHLLEAKDEDGSRMTDKQLRDETMTLFLAGHDTTSLVLTWGWYVLARHPEVVHNLEAELRDVLGGRPPTMADLPRLRYTEMVVQEVMRLYPPAWVIGREAVAACEVGGWHIPAGGTVLLSQYVVHRDPRWYNEPERFRPERWADDLMKRLPKFAYFPFGGGPRVCIGNTFAQIEATLVLATIAQRFRFQRASDAEVKPRPAITLQPGGPVELRLQRVS
jgi:cytochrome P450